MLDFTLISTILAVFTGLGIMVAGCGYAYSTWKAGSNKYKDEIIADQKATILVKEDIIDRLNGEKSLLITLHQEQITKLQTEMAAMTARFEEQTKQMETYKTILQASSPESLKMLTEIKNSIVELQNLHKASDKNLLTAADKLTA